MREEVRRINKLVADGKLSPEDAADLIDAFYASERVQEPASAPPPPPGDPSAPPPPHPKDPIKSLVESIERLAKEASDSVNWSEVSRQTRASARKGYETLKTGVEEISKGKVNIGWLGGQETREVTLPLAVPNGKVLRIENSCGGVSVLGGFDVGSVTASARFRGPTPEEARARAEAYTLILEESDHAVIVRQPDISGLHMDLEVQVAGHPMAEVRTQAGDVQVFDTKGGCRVSARSGGIRLRGLNGPIDVSAESAEVSVEDCDTPSLVVENKQGNIVLRRVKGNLSARTASGNVLIQGGGGKTVSVESVSGMVNVDVEEPITGSLNVRTVNGHSLVDIPGGSDCRVSLSTLRGQATCGIKLADEARADGRITGRIGDGTGTLDVSAVTGNVTLEMRDQTASSF